MHVQGLAQSISTKSYFIWDSNIISCRGGGHQHWIQVCLDLEVPCMDSRHLNNKTLNTSVFWSQHWKQHASLAHNKTQTILQQWYASSYDKMKHVTFYQQQLPVHSTLAMMYWNNQLNQCFGHTHYPTLLGIGSVWVRGNAGLDQKLSQARAHMTCIRRSTT